MIAYIILIRGYANNLVDIKKVAMNNGRVTQVRGGKDGRNKGNRNKLS